METPLIIAIATIAAGGGGIGAWFLLGPQIRKLRAETDKAKVDAAVAEDTAEDAHLKTVVEFVVGPLKREVTELRTRVDVLEEEVRTVRRKYYKLLDWARDVISRERLWPSVEGRPPIPSVPSEVLDDL